MTSQLQKYITLGMVLIFQSHFQQLVESFVEVRSKAKRYAEEELKQPLLDGFQQKTSS
jgi:hypothetical protein